MLEPDNGFRELKRSLFKENTGATAIEYGLIAAGITIAIMALVFTIGEDVSALFASVAEHISQGGKQ